MTVLFMESFDLHRASGLSGLTTTINDWMGIWNSGNDSQITMIDGFNGGQAISINAAGTITKTSGIAGFSSAYTTANDLSGQTEARFGGYYSWQSGPTRPSSADWDAVCGFGMGGNCLVVEVQGSTGATRLAYVDDGIGSTMRAPRDSDSSTTFDTGTSSTAQDFFVNEEWHSFNLHVIFNSSSDADATFTIDGVECATLNFNPGFGTFTPLPGIASWLNTGDTGHSIAWDHLWVTTGEVPIGISGVAVEGAWHEDGEDSSGNNVRPFIEIGGTRYYGSNYNTLGTDSFTGSREVLRHTFLTNPATGHAWTSVGFNSIERWGWCLNDTDGGAVLVAANLNTLDATGGAILVRNYQPTSLTVSGTVNKSDTTLAYSAHLTDTPRDLPATDKYLQFVKPSACISSAIQSDNEAPFVGIGLTFAEEYRTEYEDWVRVTGGDNFDSEFVTGYSLRGEGDKKFQSNYVTINYKNDDNASAFMQARWDYATSGDTGRWSVQQQVMVPTEGYEHLMRRLKIRGHGRALQFRILSEDGKPFYINGWVVFNTGNSQV